MFSLFSAENLATAVAIALAAYNGTKYALRKNEEWTAKDKQSQAVAAVVGRVHSLLASVHEKVGGSEADSLRRAKVVETLKEVANDVSLSS
jgi:hypothetical protein